MIVPAVTEISFAQAAHTKVSLAREASRQAFALPQAGHRNPSGQRADARYSAHAASSGNRRWN
jgi:hypothetical protein